MCVCLHFCSATLSHHFFRIIKFVWRSKCFSRLLPCSLADWLSWPTVHEIDTTYTHTPPRAHQDFQRSPSATIWVLLSSICSYFSPITYLQFNLTSGLSSIFQCRVMTFTVCETRAHIHAPTLMSRKGLHRQIVPDLSLSSSWVWLTSEEMIRGRI